MIRNSKQDYIAKHRKIRDKLIELSKTSEHACFNVARLASDLKMDIRTVRAHLKIMEIDFMGTFTDDEQRQFCTKEGIALLTNKFRAHEKSTE
jgi:DNA-binding transcriptional ArsR family regulator